MKFYRLARGFLRVRQGNFRSYDPSAPFLPDPVVFSGLRVSFSIAKSLSWTTNTCTVKIWNMSQEKRNLIKDYGDELTLYAGYREEGGAQILFTGDTTAVSHVYDQPEIVTILECGDGDKYLNQIRVSLSYASGVPARRIIKELADQMGIQFVEFAESENLVYRLGFRYIGMAKDALTILCDKLGLQASVQNNQLQVIPKNGSIEESVFEINENTGMQGVPQRFTYRSLDLYRQVFGSPADNPNFAPTAPTIPISRPIGYKVNIALNPLILPGSRIILTSRHLGLSPAPFSVVAVRHEGDNYGQVWSTQLEVVEVINNNV